MGRRLNNSSGTGGGAPAPRVITGAVTETSLTAGQTVQLTGTAPYTVTLPAPASFEKRTTFYWNDTTGTITLSTPTGAFKGGGGNDTATHTILAGQTVGITADTTDWYTTWENLPAKAGTGGSVLTSDNVAGGLYWGTPNITVVTGLGDWNRSTSSFSITLTSGFVTHSLGRTMTFSPATTLPLGLAVSGSGVLSGSLTGASQTQYELNIVISDGIGTKRATFVLNVSLTNSIPLWSTAAGALPGGTSYTGESLSTSVSATVAVGSITYSLVTGSFPSGITLNTSTGAISGTNNSAVSNVNYAFTIRASANGYAVDRSFTWQVNTQNRPTGQALYEGSASNTNGGESGYTWVAPTGVNRVNVVAIGAGGGGNHWWAGCGGGGGGLAWANGIPVTPGTGYTILVGNGGCWSANCGGCSCFPGVVGGGGKCGQCTGCCAVSATNTGAGGGWGTIAYPNTAGGGGGGGGYGPNQGFGANSGHTGCFGGGGSATSHHSSTLGVGGGGGTGIYGQGGNGACGNAGYSHQTGSGGQGGSGGTCGNPGEPWSNWTGNGYSCGGNYGGGGGGGGTSHGGGWGGRGAVRIIWGPGRSFPNTNTGDL